MDHGFWLQVWEEGRLGFHRDTVHDDLLTWSDRFLGDGEHRVLVPLCGKSLDLLWLRDQGQQVVGVELAETAVRQLHAALPEPEISEQGAFTAWRTPGLTVLCGDFFELDPAQPFDRIWDRAALVAVPPELREAYAALELAVLSPGGQILLEAFTYDQAVMSGPPHSVPEHEVRALYAAADVQVLDHRDLTGQIPFPGHDWFWLTTYLVSAV